MKKNRTARRFAAVLGTLWIVVAGTNSSSAGAAPKQPEFDWQAAPSEEMQASLTLRDAILRAFARNPQIAEAAAQIRVGSGNLDAAKSAWYPQISLQERPVNRARPTLPAPLITTRRAVFSSASCCTTSAVPAVALMSRNACPTPTVTPFTAP